jgi:hypothetical protein
MSDAPIELHAKTLLTSIADIGKAADAIDEAAATLAARPSLVPAGPSSGPPVTPKK